MSYAGGGESTAGGGGTTSDGGVAGIATASADVDAGGVAATTTGRGAGS